MLKNPAKGGIPAIEKRMIEKLKANNIFCLDNAVHCTIYFESIMLPLDNNTTLKTDKLINAYKIMYMAHALIESTEPQETPKRIKPVCEIVEYASNRFSRL